MHSFFVILSVRQDEQKDILLLATLAFLVSLFAGILGGIVAKRWDDLTEEKIIVARGMSAYRSLQLQLNRIISLETRVRLYLHRFCDEENRWEVTNEVIKTYLEEIVHETLALEMETINSIESWVDIIPTSRISETINRIRELKGKYLDSLSVLEQVNIDLEESRERPDTEIEKLRTEKEQLFKELLETRTNLTALENMSGVPIVSGSLLTGTAHSTRYESDSDILQHFDRKLYLDFEQLDPDAMRYIINPSSDDDDE